MPKRVLYNREPSTAVLDTPDDVGIAFQSFSAAPSASSATRGLPFTLEGATGVADKLGVVAKMADDSYTAGRIPVFGVDLLFIRNAAVVTLTNGTSAQSPFTAANDTLTVEAGATYEFESLIAMNQGTTSHTVAFEFGGTATFTDVSYYSDHISGTDGSVTSNDNDQKWTAVATSTVITPAITGTGTILWLRGTFKINAAGTIIPMIKYSADPTGTCECKVGSFFKAWKMPSAAVGPFA